MDAILKGGKMNSAILGITLISIIGGSYGVTSCSERKSPVKYEVGHCYAKDNHFNSTDYDLIVRVVNVDSDYVQYELYNEHSKEFFGKKESKLHLAWFNKEVKCPNI